MSDDRVGRYRLLRRIAEAPIEARATAEAPPRTAGARLIAHAERLGDAAPRRLYVVSVAEKDTRELLADALVGCVSLKHGNVVPLVDAGVFGERVYAAMLPGDALALSRLVGAIETASRSDRALVVASIATDVALGLQAGHDFGSRGLVHDALDTESILIERSGRSRVDAIFLDPWIGSETIARSASPFAAPERWKAPAGLGTDLFALGAILERLLNAKLGDTPPLDAVRSLTDVAPERRPRSAQDVADRLSKAFDVAKGRSLLASLIESVDAPVSETRIGLGAPGPAAQPAKPSVPRPTPGARGVQVPAPRAPERDKPPQTSRMGSLDADDTDAEADATVVERSPLFEEIRPRARQEENTPIALDVRAAAGAVPLEAERDDDGEEDGSTVVAPLWSEAMAKADASREDTGTRRIDPRRSSPAKGWDVKTGSRALPGRARSSPEDRSPIPLGAIPKPTPFPTEPHQRRGKPGLDPLPVLWTEESSADSEVKTRAMAGLLQASPARALPEAAPVPTEPVVDTHASPAFAEPAETSAALAPSPSRKKLSAVRLLLLTLVIASIVVVAIVVASRR